MKTQDDIYYRGLCARDARFDGVFFVGVKSTGIYCRPVCTAKTPGRDRCRFFSSAVLAEQAGFRPCLRCRPELAPGLAPMDQPRTVARVAAQRIEAGALNEGRSLEDLALSLGLSSRQLRRVVVKELGVSPVELVQTNRLLLAKRLIAETDLPMTQVAFAAGFESVRRFNALFRSHYRLTPSELRRGASRGKSGNCLRLTLSYRPPLEWERLLRFLERRAIPGVECVTGNAYQRTVGIGDCGGWLSVSPVEGKNVLAVEMATELAPALPTILARLRGLFDLDARPDVIAGQLACDAMIGESVKRQPGLRVPGAFDAFELCLRAVLGQQVSVAGASTLAGRFAERFGEEIETPIEGLNRITPQAEVIASTRSGTVSGLGLPSARGECVRNLARVISRGEIDLEAGMDVVGTVSRLMDQPGIGAWTAEYIAMRGMRWPDAFPAGDLGLLRSAGMKSAKELERVAERWRPWRAYAAMHLWESLAEKKSGVKSDERKNVLQPV